MNSNPHQEQKHIPSQVPYESDDFGDTLSHLLGAIRYDLTWDNEIPQFRLMMKTINLVRSAIKKDLINLNNQIDLKPDDDLVYRMDRIWNGGCHFVFVYDDVNVNPKYKLFTYGDPRYDSYANLRVRQKLIDLSKKNIIEKHKLELLENPLKHNINPFQLNSSVLEEKTEEFLNNNEGMQEYIQELTNEYMKSIEVVPLPKMKELTPIGSIDSDRWGVVVRVEWELKYAWEGVQFGTVVNDGQFYHYTAEGLIPKIQPEDMESTTKKTSVYAMHNYQALMDTYTYYMQNLWSDLSIIYQKILKSLRGGYVTINDEKHMEELLKTEMKD